jgi:SAM-dependent methyltransferase
MATPASAWVERFAALVPPGEVLDLACGSGRHAALMAGLGHPVLAADRDAAALALAGSHAGVTTMEVDLEAPGARWPFPPQRFAGIVVCNYLHRPLMRHLVQSLRHDGVLIYETFSQGNAVFGKPSNPAFLLEPAELLATPLRVIAYEDGIDGNAMVQRAVLCGPSFDRFKAVLSAKPA